MESRAVLVSIPAVTMTDQGFLANRNMLTTSSQRVWDRRQDNFLLDNPNNH